MLCLSRAAACLGTGVPALALALTTGACAGAPPAAPNEELAPYVHPYVSGRLSVRVVDVDPTTEPVAPIVPFDLLDDERAAYVDPEVQREQAVSAALGGAKRPTLDCFAPGQEAADVWIVGRTGNAGHVRALDVASTTAGREATRCVLSRLWKAMLPESGIAFSYWLHVEPWNPQCTTIDCETLPDPTEVPAPRARTSDASMYVSSFSPARWVPRLRRCYNTSLARDPTLSGSVRLRVVVGDDGVVRGVAPERSTLTDPGLVSCIQAAISSVTLPPPPNGPMELIYPITFSGAPASPPPPREFERDMLRLDELRGRDIVDSAEAAGLQGAVVPGGEDGSARPFVVFLEKDGHVAAVRRVSGEVRSAATRRSIRTGDMTLVLDDPDLAYDPAFFAQLQEQRGRR